MVFTTHMGSTVPHSDARLVELDRDECLRLIAGSAFGRVCVVGQSDVPVIRPVNYRFDAASQRIVFRTAAGSKLHALLHARRAAFEIDDIDPASGLGWSVVAIGVSEEVTNPIETSRLDRLGLEVWVPGDRPHWMTIRVWTVSGRRIVRSGASGSAPA